jgi:hypothetical protein
MHRRGAEHDRQCQLASPRWIPERVRSFSWACSADASGSEVDRLAFEDGAHVVLGEERVARGVEDRSRLRLELKAMSAAGQAARAIARACAKTADHCGATAALERCVRT